MKQTLKTTALFMDIEVEVKVELPVQKAEHMQLFKDCMHKAAKEIAVRVREVQCEIKDKRS